ncbi:MAG: UbiA family prenyltransferase [Niabella sp.]
MPVYWFALSQPSYIYWPHAALIFVILHLLVYPSSNGYNSYMDKDEGSIGGIAQPLPVERQLLYVTVFMDIIALGLCFLINLKVVMGIAVYITASRLYSYRGVRLKQYPVAGYLTVIICQGALVYHIVSVANNASLTISMILFPAIISSLLIGGTYPLTQIYQHEQDKKDGVITLSYRLGVKGTFVFCAIVLFIALLLLTVYFVNTFQLKGLLLYGIAMLPVGIYFTRWFLRVVKTPGQANFKNLMKMNYIASVCNSIAFIGILLIRMLRI